MIRQARSEPPHSPWPGILARGLSPQSAAGTPVRRASQGIGWVTRFRVVLELGHSARNLFAGRCYAALALSTLKGSRTIAIATN